MRWPLAAALLCLSAAEARADALPYDEEFERPLKSRVTITGIDRFPDHALILYPSVCFSTYDYEGERGDAGEEEAETEDDRPDPPGSRNFTRLVEGASLTWLRGENYCDDSSLYALPPAMLDELAAMGARARDRRLREDPKILRTTYRLPETTPAVLKRSPLRAVDESIVVRSIGAAGLEIVIEAITLRYRGGGEHRVPIGRVERPWPYPNDPLSDAEAARWASGADLEETSSGGEAAGSTGGAEVASAAASDAATTDTASADAATTGSGGLAAATGSSGSSARAEGDVPEATAGADASAGANASDPAASTPRTDGPDPEADDDASRSESPPPLLSRNLLRGLIAALIAALALWAATRGRRDT
ncbi:MAG: hypothetical protein H6711_26005 [Myxococcales bacterium]|nr:hypothetical protein [Myxococcales bacterium]